jgi:hypothetical protein
VRLAASLLAVVLAAGAAPAAAGGRGKGRGATKGYRLPPVARRLTGTLPAGPGPNCLNAVELWHGLARKQGWTSWRKLDRKLQDPARFRQLAPGEAPREGDVIVYRHGPGDLIEHGAIYLDARHVWEKASADATTPWRIASRLANARTYYYTVVEYYRRVERPRAPRQAKG